MYVAIDFDECLVTTHHSKTFGNEFERRNNIPRCADYGHSSHALENLLLRYKNFPAQDLDALAQDILATVQWRKGAEEFLSSLIKNPSIEVEIISSGLDIPIRSFLAKHELDLTVHSCALDFANGICTGYGRAVSSEDKKSIIENAIARHGYNHVFSIGHSDGDLSMMAASRSLCIPKGCKSCEGVAEYSADDFSTAYQWLMDQV